MELYPALVLVVRTISAATFMIKMGFHSLHLLYGGKIKQMSSGILQVVAGNDGKPVPQFSPLARRRHTFGRVGKGEHFLSCMVEWAEYLRASIMTTSNGLS